LAVQAIVFYLLASVITASAVGTIISRNPVHSVLWLILAFFNAAGLFLLLGAEFLAMIMVIVYVGAVAVLFLFVVMMLDIDFAKLRAGVARYLPFGLLLALVLVSELAVSVGAWTFAGQSDTLRVTPFEASAGLTNTQALGTLLYTRYAFVFIASGMVLLVAMIGAIVLTHRERPGVRRQKVWKQNLVSTTNAIDIVKVPSGEGVEI